MATATLLSPVSEEAEDRKRDARKHWDWIQQGSIAISVNSLRIGFHAAILKRDNLFGILGFEAESDAQEASGVGTSTWYSVIRIAEQFPGVKEDLFIGMKLTNAKALCDVPESKRLTEYWMRRAQTDSIEKFAEAVDEEMNGKTRASEGREKILTFKQTMPESAKKNVEEGLKSYAKENNVKPEQALPMLVAEHAQSVSLLASITHAIEKIGGIKKLRESGLSSDEVLDKAMVSLEEIVAEFSAAVLAVRQSGGEE